MAKILSQSEIDELLNALNTGEDITMENEEDSDRQGIRVYDFRTANKFSKEQMRTLNILFDTFASLLSNKLTGMLHTVCELEVVSVEEQSFGEFNNSIPTPVALGIVEMPPLQGTLLIELSASLVYGLISRLFGGQADYMQTQKTFTEIELSIVDNIMQQVTSIMEESWDKIVKVKPDLVRIETSSQFTQIVETHEPAAIVTLNTKVDEIEGIISICIPHLVIQPVAKRLNTTNWTLAENAKRVVQDSKKEEMEEQMQSMPVSIQTVFHDTQAPLREILNMQVGDIICIDHSIHDYVDIKIENIAKFKGVIGIDNNKYAVQIAEIIKENKNSE